MNNALITLRNIFLIFTLIAGFLLLTACKDGESSTGAGSEDLNLDIDGISKVFDDPKSKPETKSSTTQPVAATQAVAATEPVSTSPNTASNDFRLEFEQSHQACSSCGIWFTSAQLVIDHSGGRYTKSQTGSLLIKKAPRRQGRFSADISPVSPDIRKATLYMRLHSHEGVASADNSSVIKVYGYINGRRTYLRDISVKNDIKGKGYSKGSNPNVPIDFTDYARRLR